MSELSAQFVKLGYWVNLSQGRIMGQTLTTDTKTGSVIVAVLAVCTTLGMSHLWNLTTFFSHQIRADGRPVEGLVRQQQALLRTLPTPSSFTADSIKLAFIWRKMSSKKVLGQSVAQILIAFLFTIGSLAAGIFASYAVSGSNLEDLVKSPYCGLSTSRPYISQVSDVSERYARECYQDGESLPARCNIFVHPRIEFTTENASCPFPGQCISQAIAFDTGLGDVIKQFGLNMAPENRMKHRVRRTYAVLSSENRTSIINASDVPFYLLGRTPLPQERILVAHLGTREGESSGSPWANATFGFSLQRTNSFSLHSVHYRYRQPMSNVVQPPPELIVRDADTLLLAVFKGGASYSAQINDPLFSAHQQSQSLDTQSQKNYTYYASDTPLSVLGCTEQYQLCFANGSAATPCTELGGLPMLLTLNETFPRASRLQLALSNILISFAYQIGFRQIQNLNVSSLASVTSVITYLPDDQWKREGTYIMTMNLAALQTITSDFAIGPAARDGVSAQSYKIPPESQGERQLCTVQKMRKGGGFA